MNYYNEFDPAVADWLRVLIDDKLIPAGDIDTRSITDVKTTDLRGYTQHHFFAGIGGWPLALRLAGWPDDRAVATCSCPCPPFSAAGKKKACPQCSGTNPMPHVGRTGFFVCCLCGHEWFADERHLWPEAWRLFRGLKPVAIFGEQVASNDGRVWLAGVRASLEILGYDFGGADLCSSSVGAPNIRQRLFWLAQSTNAVGRPQRVTRQDGCDRQNAGRQEAHREPGTCGEVQRVAFSEGHEHDRSVRDGDATRRGRPSDGCWMGKPIQQGLEGHAGNGDDRHEPGRNGAPAPRPTAEASDVGRVEKSNDGRCSAGSRRESEGAQSESRERESQQRGGDGRVDNATQHRPEGGAQLHREHGRQVAPDGRDPRRLEISNGKQSTESARTRPRPGEAQGAGPTGSNTGRSEIGSNFWSDAIWHLCRDGKQRRIPAQSVLQRVVARLPEGMDLCGAENGFPLAKKMPKRVMLLKGYGNAINPRIAAEFIKHALRD